MPELRPLAAGALACALALTLVPATAAAQPAPEAPREWQVTLGAAMLLAPDYPGSSRYGFSPVPLLDVRWRDGTAFFGLRPGLGLYGGGVALLSSGPWRAGPVLRYRFGRDEGDNPALRGLRDLDGTLEAGGFAAYVSPNLNASLEVRNGLGGGHEGIVADFVADAIWRPFPTLPLQVSAGPRLAYGGAGLSRAFYGVDAAQSRRSGLPAFRPRDSFTLGAGVGVGYRVAPGWTVGAFAEVAQILGDARRSPLVRDRESETQAQLGLSVTYSFGWGAR